MTVIEWYSTSLAVSRIFEKRHDNVLQAISNLHCDLDFRTENYVTSTFVDTRNREQPYYKLTKKGFLFLVVGFTGHRAGFIKQVLLSETDNTFTVRSNYIAQVFGKSPESVSSWLQLQNNRRLGLYLEVEDSFELTSYGIYELIRNLGDIGDANLICQPN